MNKKPLQRCEMDLDPIKQFKHWLKDAEQAEILHPNAMTLATSSRLSAPSARIVLLRGLDERGFIFFTNYESRKAQEINENPKVSLVFCWLSLSRQVRVEGSAVTLDPIDSDLYFANRPRGHQIEAHASAQSQVIENRSFLEHQFERLAQTFEGKDVPRPLNWGGYRVVPELVEFWQEGESRLHDRLRYRRNDIKTWVIERLAP
jgi:pyridoxamine 5'-phosphate oxidase